MAGVLRVHPLPHQFEFGSFLAIDEPLEAWVNDALMVVFFFVVGLEIKKELVSGELANPRAAALPRWLRSAA